MSWLPFLQTYSNSNNNSYTNGPTEEAMTIFFIVMGVLAVVVIIAAIRAGVTRSRGKGPDGKTFSLWKTCKTHGLDRDHFKILKRTIKDQKIKTPAMLFTTPRFLNGTLAKLLTQIEKSSFKETEKETLKSEIFEIKQRVFNTNNSQSGNLTTKGIPLYQESIIFSKAFPPLKTEILGKTNDGLLLRHPLDASGQRAAFKQGTPVKVRYVRDEGKVYTFVTKVTKFGTSEGEATMMVDHSEDVKRVQLRKSPRKETHKPVFYYRVDVITEGVGRKQVRKAAIDKSRRLNGTMIDISAGGCAIVARLPLQKDSLIMVNFDIAKDNSTSVFGRVKALRKESGGTLMHIAFTKVSQKSLNDIKAFVFGFLEEEEKPRNHYLTY